MSVCVESTVGLWLSSLFSLNCLKTSSIREPEAWHLGCAGQWAPQILSLDTPPGLGLQWYLALYVVIGDSNSSKCSYPLSYFSVPLLIFEQPVEKGRNQEGKNLLKFLKQAKSRGTDCTLVGGFPVLPWVFYSYYRVLSALWLIHSQVFIVISLLIFISDTSLLAQGWWLFCVLTLVDFWELGGFSVCIYIISKQQQFDSLSTWVLVISLAGLLWLKLLKVKEVVILFFCISQKVSFLLSHIQYNIICWLVVSSLGYVKVDFIF